MSITTRSPNMSVDARTTRGVSRCYARARMLRVTTATVFAALLLGMSAVGVASASAAAPNPASNIPLGPLPPSCAEAPLSASCESAVVGYLNEAHHELGLAPYELPPSFLTLSPARQVLVLSDLDRSAYGISPVLGLNDTLDAAADEGVTNNGDPRAPSQLTPGGTVFGWGSNWAGGFANVLVAYYVWMYDDGYGSPNRDCSSPGAPGCWGHRQNVLLSFGSAPTGWISMGAAAGSYPSHAGYAMLVAYTREQPVYSYTWATALAEGGGREALPATVTGTPSSLTTDAATLNATVNPEGQTVTACYFEYGPTEEYGSVAPCSQSPGSGTTAVAVTAPISGLNAGAGYHFRIVATSAAGTSRGEDEAFTTSAAPQEDSSPPTITAEPASAITQSSATIAASVNPNGAAVESCRFQYGPTSSYGSSIACSSLPGSGPSGTRVSATIAGLLPGTPYYYRAVATNPGGTTYGPAQVLVTTPSAASSAPGGGGPPAPQAIVTISAGDAQLASASLTASASGLVRIRLRCEPAGAPCSGAIVLRALRAVAGTGPGGGAQHRFAPMSLGSVIFTTAGGRTTFDLHLTAAARRLLAHVHILRPLLTISSRAGAGGLHTTRLAVTLRALKTARRPLSQARTGAI